MYSISEFPHIETESCYGCPGECRVFVQLHPLNPRQVRFFCIYPGYFWDIVDSIWNNCQDIICKNHKSLVRIVVLVKCAVYTYLKKGLQINIRVQQTVYACIYKLYSQYTIFLNLFYITLAEPISWDLTNFKDWSFLTNSQSVIYLVIKVF